MSVMKMRLLLCACVLGFTFDARGQDFDFDLDQFVLTGATASTPYGYADDEDDLWFGLEAMSDARVDGPGGFGEAKARGSVLGTIGAYAAISGTTTEEDIFRVEASANRWTEYTIESATLAMGTPVTGIFTLDIDGTLKLLPAMVEEPDLEFASVFVYVEWYINGEYQDILVEASGDLYADGLSTYGDWTDEDWVTSQDGDTLIAMLDLLKDFTFEANVGDKIIFDFYLTVDTWEFTENATVFAEADFYNTAGFNLGAEEPGVEFVQLEVPIEPTSVPEPGSLITLLAGVVLLASRRPRRASLH